MWGNSKKSDSASTSKNGRSNSQSWQRTNIELWKIINGIGNLLRGYTIQSTQDGHIKTPKAKSSYIFDISHHPEKTKIIVKTKVLSLIATHQEIQNQEKPTSYILRSWKLCNYLEVLKYQTVLLRGNISAIEKLVRRYFKLLCKTLQTYTLCLSEKRFLKKHKAGNIIISMFPIKLQEDDQEQDHELGKEHSNHKIKDEENPQMREGLKNQEAGCWTLITYRDEYKPREKEKFSYSTLDENKKFQKDVVDSVEESQNKESSLSSSDFSDNAPRKLKGDDENFLYQQKIEKRDSDSNIDAHDDKSNLSLNHSSYENNNSTDENSILKEQIKRVTFKEDHKDIGNQDYETDQQGKKQKGQHVLENENLTDTDQEGFEEEDQTIPDKFERKQDKKRQHIENEHQDTCTFENEIKDEHIICDNSFRHLTTRKESYSYLQKVKEVATEQIKKIQDTHPDISMEECEDQLTKVVKLCEELTDVKCEMNMDSNRAFNSFQNYEKVIGQLCDFVVTLMSLRISERFGCQPFHFERETLMELGWAIPYGGEADMKKVFMQAMAAKFENIVRLDTLPSNGHVNNDNVDHPGIQESTIDPHDNLSQEDILNRPDHRESNVMQPEEDTINQDQPQGTMADRIGAQATGGQAIETEEEFVNCLLSKILSVLLIVLQTIASQFDVSENADRLERYLRECWNSFEELCGNMRQLAAESLAAAAVQKENYPLPESKDIILEVGKECLQICLTQLAQQLFHPLDRSFMTAVESSISVMRDAIERRGWTKNRASTLQINHHPILNIGGDNLTGISRNNTENQDRLYATETSAPYMYQGEDSNLSENLVVSDREASVYHGLETTQSNGTNTTEHLVQPNIPDRTIDPIPSYMRSNTTADTGYSSESTPSSAGVTNSSDSSQSSRSSNASISSSIGPIHINTLIATESCPEPVAPASEHSDTESSVGSDTNLTPFNSAEHAPGGPDTNINID